MENITPQVMVGVVGLLATAGTFLYQIRRAIKLRKAEVYQKLEMASNDLFKFEAQYADAITPYVQLEPGGMAMTAHGERIARTFIFQTLNLFEIASRYRKEHVFEPEIYTSWVAWKYELLEGWYFRKNWYEIRENYVKNLHLIFDQAVEDFDVDMPEHERKAAFFLHVGQALNCQIITDFAKEIKAAPAYLTDKAKAKATPVRCGWAAKPSEIDRLASLIAREMIRQPSYISHGEIQEGMSPDGYVWADDIEMKTREWLKSLAPEDQERTVAAAYALENKDPLGIAILSWHLDEPAPYAVLQDMAVLSDSRSHGVGRQLIDWLESEVKAQGAQWLFLESGLNNHRAHSFFERQGFRHISNVYGKDLRESAD